MTARLTVAERVARLRDLTDDERWELLVALDAKSPRNMDTAIEYMQAAYTARPAFTVHAEIADDDEVYVRPADGQDDEPPRASEDQELCGATAAEEPDGDRPWNCNAAAGHGGRKHATWGARGILLAAWPVTPPALASWSLRFRPQPSDHVPAAASDPDPPVSLASARAGRIGGTP